MPWPTKTASASNSSSSVCVWLVPEKSSSQGMSSVRVALRRPERRLRAGDDAHERDGLEVRAAVADRLEAGLLELGGEVVGGEFLAAGAGAAPFEPVARQVATSALIRSAEIAGSGRPPPRCGSEERNAGDRQQSV